MALLCGCPNVRRPLDQPRAIDPITHDLPSGRKTEPVGEPRHVEEVRAIVKDPPVMPRANPKPHLETIAEVNGKLQDAFFDYDRADANPEAVAALRLDASLLRAILVEFPKLRVVVEGHCDERGSAEYNLGLGERRASRALDILLEFGLPADVAQVVSYGKEAPQCTDAAESCRRLNRRAHLVARESSEFR